MKPLLGNAGLPPSSALFAYGNLLHGQSLSWVLSGSRGQPAQLRGRMWRLSSGAVLLSVDPAGIWVHGELHPQPPPRSASLLADLLAAPGVEPRFVTARARVGLRAQAVRVWAAPAEQLRALGAHPLGTGDWTRIAPRD